MIQNGQPPNTMRCPKTDELCNRQQYCFFQNACFKSVIDGSNLSTSQPNPTPQVPAAPTLEQLAKRVEELEARLEIDHCYVMVDGELVREPLSAKDRASFPDAVSCRDETIKLLEQENERLAKDAERYRWIRDAGATFYTGVNTDKEQRHHVCEWAMDAAIDDAMAHE